MSAERLQKVLAAAGIASRRASEALIAAGRVTVDGRTATIGESADPSVNAIAVDGRPITRLGASSSVHLLLHKPAGVTSTVRDRHAERTVLDLVPRALMPEAGRLYPVGRLDLDSEGLLLLTNDGAWSERVLHPRFGVEREYAIGLATPLTTEQVRTLERGIALDEGPAELHHLRPASAPETSRLADLIAPPPPPLVWYRATLRQGRKRQLRRMFGAVGSPIERLVRVRIGTTRLDRLRSGEVRPLSAAEVRALGAGFDPALPQRPAPGPFPSTDRKPAPQEPATRATALGSSLPEPRRPPQRGRPTPRRSPSSRPPEGRRTPGGPPGGKSPHHRPRPGGPVS